MMGALIVIMVIAFVFNDYLVEEQIPELAVDVIQDMELSRIGFLAALKRIPSHRWLLHGYH